MKKLIILTIPILLLSGCELVDNGIQNNQYAEKVKLNDDFYIYTDKETCVEYFVSSSAYNFGNVSPRYNQDGTLKLNKKCLINLESEVN